MSTRATVTITNEDHREQVARWARNVEPGTVVTFRKKSRSTEQSAKMWAMLHEVADQVEWYGQKIDAEDWKDMFTASLRHARVVPGIDKGTFVPLGMHTSTMTIEEMTNLIELIYAFGAEHSVVFKEPKESEPAAASPHAPAEAGDADPIPSPDAADGASDPPPASSSAATITACAREMLAMAGLSYQSNKERDEAMQQCLEQWAERLPGVQAHMDDISVAARAVATKQRTPAQARVWLAERLGTTVEEIGGQVDG